MENHKNKWLTSKQIREQMPELSKVTIWHGLERLIKWGYVESKKDEGQRRGYKYRLIDEEDR